MTSIEVSGLPVDRSADVLTPEALEFLADLQRQFGVRRDELLAARRTRRERIAAGERPAFLDSTAEILSADWQVAPAPRDLQDRRVEITGPTSRKMAINALNSGARVWLADLEDANTRTGATSSRARSTSPTPSGGPSRSRRRRARATS